MFPKEQVSVFRTFDGSKFTELRWTMMLFVSADFVAFRMQTFQTLEILIGRKNIGG